MVDRPDPLSRTVPAAGTGSGSRPARRAPSPKILLPAIACLELLWLGWYLYVPLPSYPTVVIRRGHLLLKTFPEVVRDTSFRQSMLGKGLMELSHVENLPQRLPIVLAAALIAAAAIGIGDLTTGLLGIRHRLRWPVRIALDYGLGAAILGVFTLVVGRMGWLDPWSFRIGLGSLAGLGLLGCRPWRRRDADAAVQPPSPADPTESARGSAAEAWLFGLLLAPFVTITILGSMLPATDFDVLEYHLQGPKEYFQAGRIHYLPHNIYTNMPFDVEMLHLLGMEVMADWWWGALSGQLLVALFGPAAAVLIHATAGRFSSRAGWFAALVYLSTPWVYRFGVIAYVEGPLCFYQAALVWAWLALPTKSDRMSIEARSPLIGLLAGAAMGCKYTALISSVIPASLLAVADGWRGRSVRPLLAFALGCSLIVGPWLVKNVRDTGDPVYPLGYRIFHGRDWDASMEAKWRTVHGPRAISWQELGGSIVDVAGRSDWQSSLYVALAPLALLRAGSRRTAIALWGFAGYVFLTWWLLTHRLDRFWLPILPVLAVLAGLGADWVRDRGWTILLSILVAVSLVMNLTYESSGLAGITEWTRDLSKMRREIPAALNRPLIAMDKGLPRDARILLVGPAAVFHLEHPVIYNTVFNRETIEELSRHKDPAAFRRALRDLGLTHVYVDWHDIERYRQPGNYGFTAYVTPARFAEWVAAGVLDRPVYPGEDQALYRIR